MKSNSLVLMLCKKFKEEIPHLEFKPIKGKVVESYTINEETFTLDTEVDAIEVISPSSKNTIVYIDNSKFVKVPAEFESEDFIKIYETIVKISGKSVKLHRGDLREGVIIEPKICI